MRAWRAILLTWGAVESLSIGFLSELLAENHCLSPKRPNISERYLSMALNSAEDLALTKLIFAFNKTDFQCYTQSATHRKAIDRMPTTQADPACRSELLKQLTHLKRKPNAKSASMDAEEHRLGTHIMERSLQLVQLVSVGSIGTRLSQSAQRELKGI